MVLAGRDFLVFRLDTTGIKQATRNLKERVAKEG